MSWVLCVVRSLLRADHSSRGVLPTVVRRCVWSRNLVNEEVQDQWGLSRQNEKHHYHYYRQHSLSSWFIFRRISVKGLQAEQTGYLPPQVKYYCEISQTIVCLSCNQQWKSAVCRHAWF
jgi:hypothetical protein